MRTVTPRDRIRYRVDNLLTRGPGPLILGLFAATAVVVIIVSVAVWALGLAASASFDLFDVIWRSILTTLIDVQSHFELAGRVAELEKRLADGQEHDPWAGRPAGGGPRRAG